MHVDRAAVVREADRSDRRFREILPPAGPRSRPHNSRSQEPQCHRLTVERAGDRAGVRHQLVQPSPYAGGTSVSESASPRSARSARAPRRACRRRRTSAPSRPSPGARRSGSRRASRPPAAVAPPRRSRARRSTPRTARCRRRTRPSRARPRSPASGRRSARRTATC